MPSQFRAPGIYFGDMHNQPGNMVQPPSMPVMIGYTRKAISGKQPVAGIPTLVTCMQEFTELFGGPPDWKFTIRETQAESGIRAGNSSYEIVPEPGSEYLLYRSMLFYFANGGGNCYVLSCGSYHDTPEATAITTAINSLLKFNGPSLLVVPDAVLLEEEGCAAVQGKMLEHCNQAQNKMAILDVYNGHQARMLKPDKQGYEAEDVIVRFRERIPGLFGSYGAAYYPWLNTSLIGNDQVNFKNITNTGLLITLLKHEWAGQPGLEASLEKLQAPGESETKSIHLKLLSSSFLYARLCAHMINRLNLLPPSGAIAGIYISHEQRYGIEKAPANMPVNQVTSPAVPIDHLNQEDLLSPLYGKSVNTISMIQGPGATVWGARTLDSNHPEYRYIQVRRTETMISESIRLALKTFASEPNTQITWIAIESMISAFLNQQWKDGVLAGHTAASAYTITVGTGTSMTPNGNNMIVVNVKLAIVHPAEFTELTFGQQVQQ